MENRGTKIVHKKFGDCLRFALEEELACPPKQGVHGCRHFDAFLTFCGISGYINRATAYDLRFGSITRKIMEESDEDCFSTVYGEILDYLSRCFCFNSFDELVDVLNKMEIFDWIFDAEEELIELLPNLYYVEKTLYYICEEEGHRLFRRISPSMVSSVFGRGIALPVQEESANETLSDCCASIIGYDLPTRSFYLSLINDKDSYAEYSVIKNQFIIYHRKCLGVVNHLYPVILDNNNILVLFNGEETKIRELKDNEDCLVIEKEILVVSKYPETDPIDPYFISLCGKVTCVVEIGARE